MTTTIEAALDLIVREHTCSTQHGRRGDNEMIGSGKNRRPRRFGWIKGCTTCKAVATARFIAARTGSVGGR